MPRRIDAGSHVTLRRAVLADSGAVADLYLRARRAAVPSIPPLVHPDEAVHRWFRNVVIPKRDVWLAEDNQLVAVMVLDGDELDQLYVHPDWTGRGVGSNLIRLAQSRHSEGLWLWTFQSNHGAQRFYHRHGFVAVQRTDGSSNEEHAPDIRYTWKP